MSLASGRGLNNNTRRKGEMKWIKNKFKETCISKWLRMQVKFIYISNSQKSWKWKKVVSEMSQDQHPSSDPKIKVGKEKKLKRISVQRSLPRFTVTHNISQSLKNYLKNWS